MTPTEWAGLAVAIFTLIAGFAGAVRWMVKHYLYELRPNGGSSVKESSLTCCYCCAPSSDSVVSEAQETIRRIVTLVSASESQPEFGPQYWASSRLDPQP
jgi:hypothetical protein